VEKPIMKMLRRVAAIVAVLGSVAMGVGNSGDAMAQTARPSQKLRIYGSTTLDQINGHLAALARELEVELVTLQSNHEGVIVDALQAHMDDVDGAIINAAGLTFSSVSIHDAIKAEPFPVIEVHISNLATRDEIHQRSILSPAVRGSVMGLGWRSYTAALRALVELVREAKTAKQ
jgi:3-dehydroquinate dehydratase-2